jgi:hypothetical protein
MFTVLAALSGMEREYIRDRTLEGHESACAHGKAIGGAAVTDDAMLAVALHLRGQELSLRDIAARLVIATGKKKGQHPSPATVLRMLRAHDEKAAAAAGSAGGRPSAGRLLVVLVGSIGVAQVADAPGSQVREDEAVGAWTFLSGHPGEGSSSNLALRFPAAS